MLGLLGGPRAKGPRAGEAPQGPPELRQGSSPLPGPLLRPVSTSGLPPPTVSHVISEGPFQIANLIMLLSGFKSFGGHPL